MNILIPGASYGSLLSTKLLMAGHDVTLVCLPEEVKLINARGTIVRLTLRNEPEPRLIRSGDQPGRLNAVTPEAASPDKCDLVCFAMQEPQYQATAIAELMTRIAASGKPCLSIMNMPPHAYLKRLPLVDAEGLRDCFSAPEVWDAFDPDLVTLCSPDPQAFRPPEEELNFLHVGLPTNFKAAAFASPDHTSLLSQLAKDIDAVRIEGKEVPVKLRLHKSLYVPLAKWSMLLTGNYRCVTADGMRSIKDTVYGDVNRSQHIYEWVDALVQKLGADPSDRVPFEKYANAALKLLKPSSAARAIDAGAPNIERVDKLVQKIAAQYSMQLDEVDATVSLVNNRLAQNNSVQA